MKTQAPEKDAADLTKLDTLFKAYQRLSTAQVSRLSGLPKERILHLLNNYQSRTEKSTDTSSVKGIPADLWTYRPTADIAPHHTESRIEAAKEKVGP